MSVELDFWKYKADARKNDGEVYDTVCCGGGSMEGLAELPVGEIIEKIAETFSDWRAIGRVDYEKDGSGTFSVSTTPQSVRIDCYDMSGEDMSRLIELMEDFDCPLYDPRLGERFDRGNMGLFALLS